MSQDVANYISSVVQPWQAKICRELHQRIQQAIPEATERLQYGKPHYLKDGKYACVVGTAKSWVTLTIFNATGIDGPDGLFEPGPPERKTVKIKQGQMVDYDLLTR